MEAIEKDNLAVTAIEPNQEEINDKDEIRIIENISCCVLTIMIVFSIVFPFLFFVLFICQPLIRMIRIDKKKKTLIKGGKPIIYCCYCSFSNERIYDLNEVKNVKIIVTSRDDPLKGFGKIYIIEGYIYSNNDECECLFSNIKYTKEKYDEYVSFFKKYVTTIEEPLEFEKDDHNLPNEIDITTGEQNNIESKPSMNESAPTPITY